MAKNTSINQAKYDAKHCRHYSLKYNLVLDEAVVKKLSSVPSVQGYIKQLILADLAKESESEPVPKTST